MSWAPTIWPLIAIPSQTHLESGQSSRSWFSEDWRGDVAMVTEITKNQTLKRLLFAPMGLRCRFWKWLDAQWTMMYWMPWWTLTISTKTGLSKRTRLSPHSFQKQMCINQFDDRRQTVSYDSHTFKGLWRKFDGGHPSKGLNIQILPYHPHLTKLEWFGGGFCLSRGVGFGTEPLGYHSLNPRTQIANFRGLYTVCRYTVTLHFIMSPNRIPGGMMTCSNGEICSRALETPWWGLHARRFFANCEEVVYGVSINDLGRHRTCCSVYTSTFYRIVSCSSTIEQS